jgi:hypothetical protein
MSFEARQRAQIELAAARVERRTGRRRSDCWLARPRGIAQAESLDRVAQRPDRLSRYFAGRGATWSSRGQSGRRRVRDDCAAPARREEADRSSRERDNAVITPEGSCDLGDQLKIETRLDPFCPALPCRRASRSM